MDSEGNRWLDYYEVREVLGISRERARQLKSKLRHQLFSDGHVVGGREMLFLADDVVAYKETRRPGRPKNAKPQEAELAPPVESADERVMRLATEVKLLKEHLESLSRACTELAARLSAVEGRSEGALIIRVPRIKDPRS